MSSVSSVFQSSFFPLINNLEQLSQTAVTYLSPKQSMRMDSYVQTFNRLIPKAYHFLALKAWTVQSVFKDVIPGKECTVYLNVLTSLKRLMEENSAPLNAEERVNLNTFCKNFSSLDAIRKFDLFIFSKHSNLRPVHRAFKDLMSFASSNEFENFKSKISRAMLDQALNENEKLDVSDINLLSLSPTVSSLAESLHRNEIEGVEVAASRWSEISNFYHSDFFRDLQQVCLESRPTGTVLLGNYNTYNAIGDGHSDFVSTLIEFFMGRLAHVAIFVKPKDKPLCLSHVSLVTNTHALTPVRFSLLLPFHYAVNLDISSLIPAEVSEEHKTILAKTFSESFEKFAEEPHPELPLAGFKEHVEMFILGHKTYRSSTLEDIDLPKPGTPTMCSSYVGIVFLKALHEVNLMLEKLNYSERIDHPFGRHENLMEMDILRLVYLWQKANVVTPIAVPEKVLKVMVIPQPHSLF